MSALFGLLFIFVVWVWPIMKAYDIGMQRGQGYLIWWGVLLGWLGVLVILCFIRDNGLGSSPAKCPECLALIPRAAHKCRYCGTVQPL